MENGSKAENHDIAEDSWISKWPDSLRWILFLPLAVAAAFSASAIIILLASFGGHNLSPGSLDGGWYRMVQSFCFGGAFVFTGAFIAPKKQFITAVGMLVLSAIILTFIMTTAWLYNSEDFGFSLLHAVITLVGASASTYYVYEELN